MIQCINVNIQHNGLSSNYCILTLMTIMSCESPSMITETGIVTSDGGTTAI